MKSNRITSVERVGLDFKGVAVALNIPIECGVLPVRFRPKKIVTGY